MLRTGSNISHSSGQIKEKLVGRVFLLFWENDRAAITIISWGFGGEGVLWAPSADPGQSRSPGKFFEFSLYFLIKMC